MEEEEGLHCCSSDCLFFFLFCFFFLSPQSSSSSSCSPLLTPYSSCNWQPLGSPLLSFSTSVPFFQRRDFCISSGIVEDSKNVFCLFRFSFFSSLKETLHGDGGGGGGWGEGAWQSRVQFNVCGGIVVESEGCVCMCVCSRGWWVVGFACSSLLHRRET